MPRVQHRVQHGRLEWRMSIQAVPTRRARRYLARLDGRPSNDRIAQLIDQLSRSE
jgi:hypothetical protein